MEEEEDYNHDPNGIWFTGGGYNRLVYQIQGDGPTSRAAFVDCYADMAFDEWRKIVDLPQKMDEAARFFRKNGSDIVLCVHARDKLDAAALGVSRAFIVAIANDGVPEGWTRVAAKDILNLITFECYSERW